ncbi:MAG: hypothetical protein ACR2HN_00115 [Tepidiformaceae bacterium]
MARYETVRGPQGPTHRPRGYGYEGGGGYGGGGARLLVIALSVASFLLVAAVSASQVTRPREAANLIEAGIAATTEPELFLAEHESELRTLAQSSDSPSVTLPGYPLEVFLSRDEALNLTIGELSDLIIQRAAAVVYEDGVEAFDRTGEQSVGTFSSQGLLRALLERLSQRTHDRAAVASFVLALVVALAACGVLLFLPGWRRLRMLGLAIAAAGAGGLVVTGALLLLLRATGGDDPFAADLREILTTVLAAPLRNYLVVFLLGAAITAAGILLPRVEPQRLSPSAAPGPWDYEDFGDGDEPAPFER